YDWDFLFTSRRLDKETGLMYYRNRYYHPVMGRFTTIDPLGYDAGDVNLYRYVNNQPEILKDPMGLDVIWHGDWWYDSDRTWDDWWRGWGDWGYNTGSPVLAPTGIGETTGVLEAGGGIGEIRITESSRERVWDDPMNDGLWDEYQRRCRLHNDRNH
ncbi:MAG: RHS repeat-associated core domain-containing protein, partial [Planctomycetaceae bacterium]|nr:RHS repeat-associated core domain-containing protein [Planctomycetaceae bacterium]